MRWRPVVGSTAGRIEVAIGLGLLVAVCLFGATVTGDDRPTGLDRWGFAHVPYQRHQVLWVGAVRLGSPEALVLGVALAGVAAARRGRRLAAVCMVGPLLAAALAQVAKYGFDREYAGVRTYPSGTVVVVSALATVAVVISNRWAKVPVAIAGAALVVVTGIAVVGLRWHYPTDAAAGVALGVGVVLVVHAAGMRRARDPASTA